MRVAFYDTKPYDRQYMLAAAGADTISWSFHDFRLTAETAGIAAGADAVCAFVNDRLDRACLECLASIGIRHVALRCAGFNNVGLPAAKGFGITITRVPAYSPHAVAEHTVALVLTLNRHTHRAFNRVREQNFSLNGLVGFDLHGKTCGIVGTGKIGRLAAEIFRGFGMRVIAHDPYPATDWATGRGIEYQSFDDVLEASDILSLHLPLTPQTHHMIGVEAIRRMKGVSHPRGARRNCQSHRGKPAPCGPWESAARRHVAYRRGGGRTRWRCVARSQKSVGCRHE